MTARETEGTTTGDDVDVAVSLGTASDTSESPGIWMDPEVAARIERFAATDLNRELGGVLLGEVLPGPPPQVRITAAIEARYTEAVHTSVKFTHATWEDINRVKDANYPDLRIVGWFHTHPGFGIFLSRWDLFIQENFFNLPWQVAYVVDPVGKTSGFFRWENGKVVRADQDGQAPPPLEVVIPGREAAPKRSFPWAAVVSGALNVGLAAAVVYLAFLRPPEVKVTEKTATKVRTVTRTVKVEVPAPVFRSYTVRRGDSWWRIAEQEYGDGTLWPAIHIINEPGLSPGETVSILDKQVATRLARRGQLGRKLGF